MTIRFKNAWVE